MYLKAVAGIFLCGSFLLIPGKVLGALEDEVTLSIENGGEGQARVSLRGPGIDRNFPVRYQEGVELVNGYGGKPEFRLAAPRYRSDQELLLTFDDQANMAGQAGAGGYRVIGRELPQIQKTAHAGAGSAWFGNLPDGMILGIPKGSMLEPGVTLDDFTMEFWLYPTLGGEGEEILGWDGFIRHGGTDLHQSISVHISNRQLMWDFRNVFLAPVENSGASPSRIRLSGRMGLRSHQWSHHMLRYDHRRNVLEYLVDGRPEAVVHATSDGRENGAPLLGLLGEGSDPRIVMGKGFTGLLDEFRITRSWVEEPLLAPQSNSPGYLLLGSVDFRSLGMGTKILGIDARYRTPGNTGMAFWYSMTDNPVATRVDDPSWKPFVPGKDLPLEVQGRFLHFRVDLLPDGSGDATPSFQGLIIRYRPDPPPPPPSGVVAIAGNGSVTLRWKAVPGTDIRGYMIHWGTRTGSYLGEGAFLDDGTPVSSPSRITNRWQTGETCEVRIDGLENGRMFFFRVSTYDDSNHPDNGMQVERSLSKEVSARPAR